MDGNLNIVYAADNKFGEILGVSLTSLYENNKGMDEINVYILDAGLSQGNKRKIKYLAKSYNRSEVKWLEAKNISRELGLSVIADRGSLSQYARLFISGCLPEKLERILYLDCDTIINKPLDELWNINMNGKTVAVLLDAFSKLYRKNIDLAPNDIMFNSGVMLIDLKRWKEQNIEQKLLDFIINKKGKVQQGDQGALNSILSHDSYCFEPKFNSVTIFYDFSYKEMLIYRKPPTYYSENQIKTATDNPVIIHYTTSFISKRPWIEGCKHRYVNNWLEMKAISPWKDKLLIKSSHGNFIKKAGIFLCTRMPRSIFVYVAGIFQAYIRPIFNRLYLK